MSELLRVGYIPSRGNVSLLSTCLTLNLVSQLHECRRGLNVKQWLTILPFIGFDNNVQLVSVGADGDVFFSIYSIFQTK